MRTPRLADVGLRIARRAAALLVFAAALGAGAARPAALEPGAGATASVPALLSNAPAGGQPQLFRTVARPVARSIGRRATAALPPSGFTPDLGAAVTAGTGPALLPAPRAIQIRAHRPRGPPPRRS